MNGNSKSERVGYFIRSRVRRAIYETAFVNPSDRDALKRVIDSLVVCIEYEMTSDYNMAELNDIMHWKKPKSSD